MEPRNHSFPRRRAIVMYEVGLPPITRVLSQVEGTALRNSVSFWSV
jgi:hypothetical protein